MPESHTPRGFADYKTVMDSYGHEVTVRESSSAEEPKVWIFCTCPNWENAIEDAGGASALSDTPSCCDGHPTPHLTVDDAAKVRDALQEFIEHHGEPEPHLADAAQVERVARALHEQRRAPGLATSYAECQPWETLDHTIRERWRERATTILLGGVEPPELPEEPDEALVNALAEAFGYTPGERYLARDVLRRASARGEPEAPTPPHSAPDNGQDAPQRAYAVACRRCGVEVALPPVKLGDGREGVGLEPLEGWKFTSDTGWLCPEEVI